MPVVMVVQHVEVEGLGRIQAELVARGLTIEVVAPNAPLPTDASDRIAGLVVLGGPMSVYEADRYPRLREEMLLLEAMLRSERPILGVCLGSQLLAAVLGAKVAPGPAKELGYHDITLENAAADDVLFTGLPARFTALHWHGDVFDLPPNACHLARSAMTSVQAFRYGKAAFGLLFHLESTTDQVRAMATAFPDEVRTVGTTGVALVEAARREEPTLAHLATTVYGRWGDLVRDRSI